MKFTKMHGLGNDYIYFNCFKEEIKDPSTLAKRLSNRHFGVGSDGIVLILPSKTQDFKMRMFNADGSEAEMCGNAIRCVGKYVYDNKMTDKTTVSIETLAGTKILELTPNEEGLIEWVRVDMGEPILEPRRIPIDVDDESFTSKPVKVGEQELLMTGVSMGNPHVVTYVKDVSNYPVHEVGPKVECHKLFPKKINAEFVEVIDRKTLKMRVWERGAGETMACGTGACAVLVASVLNNVSDRITTVQLLGGNLHIEWAKDNHVYMTGPAVTAFDGEIE